MCSSPEVYQPRVEQIGFTLLPALLEELQISLHGFIFGIFTAQMLLLGHLIELLTSSLHSKDFVQARLFFTIVVLRKLNNLVGAHITISEEHPQIVLVVGTFL